MSTTISGDDNPFFGFSLADDATGEVRAIVDRIGDLRPAFEEIGESMVLETQMRFEAQHSPENVPWAPLSPVTIEKRIAGGASRILRETGDNLYDTIGPRVEADGVSVGVNRDWAKIHQFGGQAGRGKKVTIPARPFLGLSSQGAEQVLHILRDHAEGK